jgi:uncharacterized protein YhjY with autotransporter beta-barrel domain
MDGFASTALISGAALAAAWLIVPEQAASQTCTTGSGFDPAYACTLPAGTYTSSVEFQAPLLLGTNDPLQMSATALGTVTVAASQGTPLIFLSIAEGNNGGGPSGSGQGLTINNQGALTVTSGSSPGSFLFGLLAQQHGGPGSNGSGNQAGEPGGDAGPQIIVTNSGAITINNVNVGGSGGALYAQSLGGPGGSADLFNSFQGGAGGDSSGSAVTNSAAITVTASGANGFGGILALGQGGSGGSDGAVGGQGGASSVTSSGPVSVTWTWQGVQSSTPNFGLYGVLAQTVGGNATSSTDGSGGHGGDATSAFVTLSQGANVSVTASGTPPTAFVASSFDGAGVGALVTGGNGNGGQANGGSSRGGAAGVSGAIATYIAITDASVTTSGNNTPALLALAQGGPGGTSNIAAYSGGNGGSTGNGVVSVTASAGPLTISTTGSGAPAIVNLLQGGAGGTGADYNAFIGGTSGGGGSGGSAGSATVTLAGTPLAAITVTTAANTSPGIFAASIGSAGGNGGNLTANAGGSGGNGGAGGSGSAVSVSVASTAITTQGDNSPGIVAQSQGGSGGAGGSTQASISVGAAGGSGGSSGNLIVTLDSGSQINTAGQGSSGIVAQSVSGAGGNAGASNGVISPGGNGGSGGSVGSITVDNDGQITTSGSAARGILAQAISGGGGGGGGSFGVAFSGAGSGGSTGSIGAITINNQGSITTSGTNAQGILAQSIAGGGGAGGQALGVGVTVGGSASTDPLDADAGAIAISTLNGSRISTTGLSAIGILGQSIGGGGGDGGSVIGGAVGIGGSGGAGGSGGNVFAVLTGTNVSTLGDGAHGTVMQSVGGGGGNAGNAQGGLGLFVSVAIGGSGGNGGQGDAVTINLSGTSIVTEGSKAAGLVVQSIGGGGGTGGAAFTGAIGPGFAASVAVGGSGGAGGSASQVNAQLVGGSIATGQDPALLGTSGSVVCPNMPCNLLPVDTYGAVIQSIGGGGGLGGSATARALAIAVPVTPSGTQVGLASSVALGGSGGSGGNGSDVSFAVSQGGTITTSGQNGTGVLLQSIGGGGGAGGDSSAMSAVLGYGSSSVPDGASSLSGEVNFSLGGKGGGGGNGGAVYMALGGSVSFSGSTPTFTADPTGAPGSTITTYGDFAAGIKAQSIGGGGGDAGHGGGNTQNFGTGYNVSVGINLGATGGEGGNGGPVTVEVFPISTANTSTILTWGSGAVGVLAQSIGGGGGTSSGGSYNFGSTIGLPVGGSSVSQVNMALGMRGGVGGTGGDVTVDVQAPITTHGGDAAAVLAQSIGGGGGVGGSAGSDASADNPIIAGLNIREALSNVTSQSAAWVGTFSQSVGGVGGFGNTGGAVSVSLNSALSTAGDWSSGIVAQSIGGGGGKGGTAAATGSGGRPDITINFNNAIGGTGGLGGNGGAVTVSLGGSTIATSGFGASGIIAQSVGGGGGIGVDGSDGAWGLISVGGATSGGGGSGGNGGTVTLNTNATSANFITTTGEAAEGVILQSVGGGGGIGGAGSSSQTAIVRINVAPTAIQAGGGQGISGSGGAVSFSDQGTVAISTSGNNAFGMVAQSVGGGGGIVKLGQVMTEVATTGSNQFQTLIGGQAGTVSDPTDGGTVNLTLNAGSSIATSGTAAHGIVAQSIGGGGGIVGLPGSLPTLAVTPTQSTSSGFGNGGAVTVTNGATIYVSGYGAFGILAQSIGGGGGLLTLSDGKTVVAGSTAQNPGLQGSGSTVSVTTNAAITASGTNGVGIFAQSTGPSGSVAVTANAAVTGGSGQGSAIWIDSAAGIANTVTVGSNGSLEAASGTAINATGGMVNVLNNGTIIGALSLNGGSVSNGSGAVYDPHSDVQHDVVNAGLLIHRDSNTIGAVTITTVNGGLTAFLDSSSGGVARFVTNAGGAVDISALSSGGMSAGSIAGAGSYLLGSKQLTVGSNDASTTVSGGLADGGLSGGTGGSLVKVGTGTLTLTGTNNYTGGTTVLAGVLQGTTMGLQGNILNQASVVFDQTGAGTYAGIMSGAGSVTVQGGGPVNFSGANTYTGATTVAPGGRLIVNGSITSPVTVGSGGYLGGSGTIFGNVTNNGIVQPGDTFVTLNINGTYTQNAGGTYAPSVNAAGQSDSIAVTGTANLAGALQAVPTSGGQYAKTTSYTILTATGAITGTFASATSTLPFLAPSLTYGASSVTLTLTQAFAAGGIGANQHAVGMALDHGSASASGDFSTVLNTLAGLDGVQGPKALDTISGQPIANAGTASVQTGSAFLATIGNQVGATHGGHNDGAHVAMALSDDIEACDATCDVAPTVIGTWLSGVGGFGSVPGNATAGGTTYSFGGTAVGADYRFGPNFLAGVSAGYVSGRQSANGFDGNTSSDTVNGTLYASFTEGAFYLDGLAGYANTTNRSLRNIVIPGLAVRTARGQTTANQFLGQLETGYRFDGVLAPALSITPFARVQGSTSTQAGFTESGADSLNLTVAQQTTNSLRGTLGAELGAKLEKIEVGVRLGWLHEFADTSRPMTAAFAGASGSPFTVFGATPQRDSAAIGFFAKARVADSTEIYARYDGEVGGGADNHAFTVGLRMMW